MKPQETRLCLNGIFLIDSFSVSGFEIPSALSPTTMFNRAHGFTPRPSEQNFPNFTPLLSSPSVRLVFAAFFFFNGSTS